MGDVEPIEPTELDPEDTEYMTVTVLEPFPFVRDEPIEPEATEW